MNIFREYASTLISFVVTLILTLIAEFILNLSNEGVYLTFAIGTTLTLTISLLDKEIEAKIKREFSQILVLYQWISEINEPALRHEVFSLAQSLSEGTIPPHIASIRSMELLKTVKHSLKALDYNDNLDSLHRWETTRLKVWRKLNREAVQRGVIVERTFIFKRSDAVKKGVWDNRILRILREQASEGIKVRVLFIEDVLFGDLPPQRNILKNLVIFDHEEVSETNKILVHMYRSPSEKVKEAIAAFEEHKKYANDLEDLITIEENSS